MLTWLVNQVNEILAKLKKAATDAYNWAVSKANDALNAAKSFAMTAVATALTTVGRWIDAAATAAQQLVFIAKYELIKLINLAAVAAGQLVDIATYKLWQALAVASTAARQLIDIAKYELFKALDVASIASKQLIDIAAIELWKAIDSLNVQLKPISDFLLEGGDVLRALVKLGPLGLIAKLTDFLNRMYNWLARFMEDPIGYIAAFVMSFFLTMLCDELAHGLGTVKYDLPPRRSYGKSGFGGGDFGGTGPPPGASTLAPPLDSVYVSGYTFGPGHPGIDLGLTMAAPVYAMHDGEVLEAGWSSVGYGFTVVLEGGGWRTRYGHLSAVGVFKGQKVSQREQIGLGDSTGNSTGPHLHLEIYWQGKAIDPLRVL